MALLDIPTKSTGDTLTAIELNNIVTAVKKLQGEKGYGVYFDTEYTDINPQVITGSEFIALENNKGSVVETYLPDGVATLYDGTKIVPASVGSGLNAYVSFIAKSSSQNSYLEFGVDIDGTFNEIFKNIETTVRGANTYQPYYLPINGYMLDTFNANGGVVKIKPKSGDTISIYNTTFFVHVNYQQQ